jgi:hypothetical protein
VDRSSCQTDPNAVLSHVNELDLYAVSLKERPDTSEHRFDSYCKVDVAAATGDVWV